MKFIPSPDSWIDFRTKVFLNSLNFYANDICRKDITFFCAPYYNDFSFLESEKGPFFAIDYLDNPFEEYPKWLREQLMGIFYGCERGKDKLGIEGFWFISGKKMNLYNFHYKGRDDRCYFRGCLSGHSDLEKNVRYQFLKRAKEKLPTKIILTIDDWSGNNKLLTPEQSRLVCDEWGNNIFYLKEMSRYKYALCPFGIGKVTWRLMEALSQKCVVISDDVSFSKFFKRGFNYITIEDFGKYDAQEISENGYKTYETYFKPRGCITGSIMPYDTFNPIAKEIRELIKRFEKRNKIL